MARDPFANRSNKRTRPQAKAEPGQASEPEVSVTIKTKKKRRVNRATSKDFARVGGRINKSSKNDWEDFVLMCKRKDGYQTQDEVIEAALMAFIKQRTAAWKKETPTD